MGQNGPKWVKMGQNGSGHALAIGRLAILQLPLLQVLQPTTDLSQTAGVIIKLPFQVKKVRKILQESQNIYCLHHPIFGHAKSIMTLVGGNPGTPLFTPVHSWDSSCFTLRQSNMASWKIHHVLHDLPIV